jgi:hypothetical protein
MPQTQWWDLGTDPELTAHLVRRSGPRPEPGEEPKPGEPVPIPEPVPVPDEEPEPVEVGTT